MHPTKRAWITTPSTQPSLCIPTTNLTHASRICTIQSLPAELIDQISTLLTWEDAHSLAEALGIRMDISHLVTLFNQGYACGGTMKQVVGDNGTAFNTSAACDSCRSINAAQATNGNPRAASSGLECFTPSLSLVSTVQVVNILSQTAKSLASSGIVINFCCFGAAINILSPLSTLGNILCCAELSRTAQDMSASHMKESLREPFSRRDFVFSMAKTLIREQAQYRQRPHKLVQLWGCHVVNIVRHHICINPHAIGFLSMSVFVHAFQDSYRIAAFVAANKPEGDSRSRYIRYCLLDVLRITTDRQPTAIMCPMLLGMFDAWDTAARMLKENPNSQVPALDVWYNKADLLTELTICWGPKPTADFLKLLLNTLPSKPSTHEMVTELMHKLASNSKRPLIYSILNGMQVQIVEMVMRELSTTQPWDFVCFQQAIEKITYQWEEPRILRLVDKLKSIQQIEGVVLLYMKSVSLGPIIRLEE